MGRKSPWLRPFRKVWESEQLTLVRDLVYYFGWPILTILAGIGGFFFIIYMAFPWWFRWESYRYYDQASHYLAKEDLDDALINIRKAIRYNISDFKIWKLAAEITQRKNLPDEVFCLKRMDLLTPGNFDLQMQVADAALKYQDYDTALFILREVSADNQTSLRYELVAGELARRLQLKEIANYYLEQVRSQQPTRPEDQFTLAQWEITSDQPKLQEAARRKLKELSSNPDFQLQALRLLIQDAMDQHRTADAQALNDQVLLNPASTLTDRLHRLNLLLADPATLGQVDGEVQELQSKIQASQDLAQMKELAQWMAAHLRAEEALIWIREQPEETQNNPGIGVARGDCLSALGLWEHLRDIQLADVWPDHEHERYMYLSRAYFALGADQDGRAAWFQALLNCKIYSQYLELFNFAQMADADKTCAHRWENEIVTLCQQLLSNRYAQPWIVQKLIDHATAEKDWAGVARYTQVLSSISPTNKNLSASSALVSLLLHQNVDKAGQKLEELLQTDPSNPLIATNAAFHFYQQGKFHLALSTVGVLTPDQLHDPGRSLYLGLLLSVAGPLDQADTYLKTASQQPHLMEPEKLLLQQAQDYLVYRRAMAGLLHGPDRAAAERIFQEKNPLGAPSTIFTIGQIVAQYQDGAIDQARQSLVQIDSSDWGPAETTLYLGAVLYLTGQTQDAQPYLELDATLPDETNLEKQHRILAAWWQAQSHTPDDLNLLTGLLLTYRLLENKETDPAFWSKDTAQQLHLARLLLLKNQLVDQVQPHLLFLQDHVLHNPSLDSLLAYSLLLQGRTDSALQRMKSLTASALSQPEPSLFYAIILLANGQKDQAKSILTALPQDQLPKEDLSLFTTTKQSL